MAIFLQGHEADVLKRVTVRLIREDERDAVDRTLEQRHYLASARLAGQTLRYVAELDGQWVALLAFSAAALRLKTFSNSFERSGGAEGWIFEEFRL